MEKRSIFKTKFIGLIKRDLLVGVASSFLMFGYASNAIAETDTLRAAVKQALDTNPAINSQLKAFLASQDDARAVFGGYLPSLDLTGAVGIADREFDSRGSYDRNSAEISLTQMLFDGFSVRNNLRKAEHESRALYYDVLAEAEDKALESSLAYLDVLRYRKMVELGKKNLAKTIEIQKLVSQRTASGVGNGADKEQVDGRVALAQSNLITEAANLQSVTSRFLRLVGRLPLDEMAEFKLPNNLFPENLEYVLSTTYDNNPELYSAYESIHSAKASFDASKANRYPTIELGASHAIYKNDNSFDERTDPRDYGKESVIELRMNYNLYNGGSDRAGEKAAYDRIDQAKSIRDNVCVNLRQTATIAYTDIINVSTRINSLYKHYLSSNEVLEAYYQQYTIGRRALLDVLDSENEAYQSERSYVNAQFDLEVAKLETLESMGLLLSSLSESTEKIPNLDDAFSEQTIEDKSIYCAIDPKSELDLVKYTQPAELSKPIILSGDALFDVSSSELKGTAYSQIKQLTDKILLNQANVNAIYITGHTDSTGSDEFNRSLSMDRATVVKDLFIDSGIESKIISAMGVGANQPIASNNTAQGRSQNRRVEIKLDIKRK
ncbi:TolC family outer membrane protein [Psychromonas aquatilis]|uniref:TolC family outer membrane protein n=1 Tax=Psychromonas aquatilis TaxID=2005072 RepID=A0ABU9GP66_9GAMM